MNLERLQELVKERPPLIISDGEVVRHYTDPHGNPKVVRIEVDILLNEEDESIVTDLLQVLLNAPEDERKIEEVDFTQRLVKLANRYIFLRDEMLKDQKRGDMMEPLYSYFYRDDVDNKYPTTEEIDDAIDILIEEEKVNSIIALSGSME
jgi:hypothetical protein